jgi:hypothetical protein
MSFRGLVLALAWVIVLLVQFILGQVYEREGMTGLLLSGVSGRSWAGASLVLLLIVRFFALVILPGVLWSMMLLALFQRVARKWAARDSAAAKRR